MTFHDIRLAVRSLVHRSVVSAIVILCLSLGIGVNATLFSVIDGVLIQPLPFAEPDRLLVLNEIFERGGIREAGVSYPDSAGLRERTTSFAPMAASSGRTHRALRRRDEAERCAGRGDHVEPVPDLSACADPRPAFHARMTTGRAPSRS